MQCGTNPAGVIKFCAFFFLILEDLQENCGIAGNWTHIS